MACDDKREEGVSVPDTNCFAKGSDLTAMLDRHLISLYTALITGLSFLLFTQAAQLGKWSGAFFLISLVLFVFGIAHSLLHVTFHAKLLLLMERIVEGTEVVPNMLDGQEPTDDAFLRNQAYSQTAFFGQLLYFLIGVVLAMIGTVIHLWDYACRSGILVSVSLALLLGAGIAYRIWKK